MSCIIDNSTLETSHLGSKLYYAMILVVSVIDD